MRVWYFSDTNGTTMLSDEGAADVEVVAIVDHQHPGDVAVGAIELDMRAGVGDGQRDVIASPHAVQHRRGTGRTGARPSRHHSRQHEQRLREPKQPSHDRTFLCSPSYHSLP